SLAVRMIGTLSQYPFHAAMKDLMGWIGLECGPCRLPQACLRDDERAKLRGELEQIGFFQWGRPPIEPASAPAAGDVGA
ncbi:MAG: hypothetical protein OER86_05950, partial [Phycisphaerae bacterium]|nr:hypothetical protein [Phycisphaerae bacterium]